MDWDISLIHTEGQKWGGCIWRSPEKVLIKIQKCSEKTKTLQCLDTGTKW